MSSVFDTNRQWESLQGAFTRLALHLFAVNCVADVKRPWSSYYAAGCETDVSQSHIATTWCCILSPLDVHFMCSLQTIVSMSRSVISLLHVWLYATTVFFNFFKLALLPVHFNIIVCSMTHRSWSRCSRLDHVTSHCLICLLLMQVKCMAYH